MHIAFRLDPGPGEYGDRTSTDDEATKLEMHAWLAGSVFESAKAYNGLCFYLTQIPRTLRSWCLGYS